MLGGSTVRRCGAPGGSAGGGGRQLPVRLAEVGLPHRQVGVARSACGGSLAALVLGGHAQGRNRPLEPTWGDGCQRDARGVATAWIRACQRRRLACVALSSIASKC